MSAPTRRKDGYTRQPRYNKEGLTDAHMKLAKYAAVFGDNEDWKELLESTTYANTPVLAYPLKNRGYLRDKKNRWREQFAKGKLNLPPLDIEEILSSFSRNDIITKIYNLSSEDEEDMPLQPTASTTRRRPPATTGRPAATDAASSTSQGSNLDASFTNDDAAAANNATSTTTAVAVRRQTPSDSFQLSFAIGNRNFLGLGCVLRDTYPTDGLGSMKVRSVILTKRVQDEKDAENYRLFTHGDSAQQGMGYTKLKLQYPNVAREDKDDMANIIGQIIMDDATGIADHDEAMVQELTMNAKKTVENLVTQWQDDYGPSYRLQNGAPNTSEVILLSTPIEDENKGCLLLHNAFFNGSSLNRPIGGEFKRRYIEDDAGRRFAIWKLAILEQGIRPDVEPSSSSDKISNPTSQVRTLLKGLGFKSSNRG